MYFLNFSGLENVDVCFGGSSIDSDASGNENITGSHTNGTRNENF